MTLEFFILFAIMAGATVLGMTVADNKMISSLLEWFQSAHQAIGSQ